MIDRLKMMCVIIVASLRMSVCMSAHKSARKSAHIAAVFLCVVLAGCGGGNSNSGDTTFTTSSADSALAYKLAAVHVAESSLVAHYDFDQAMETRVHDVSGHAYDGVAMAWDDQTERGTVWSAGQHGNALIFSEGGRVTIDSSPTLDAALGQHGISISLWFKLNHTSTEGYVRLLSKKPVWQQAEGFELEYNPVAKQIHLVCQGAHFIEGIVADEDVDLEWHHIVATLDGNTGSIRFDGQDITSIDTVPLAGLLPCPHQLTIGALANGSAAAVAPFQGTIDDLRIYDRALTLSEQRQLFIDSQNTGTVDALVGWWNADDSASTIVDSSGYSHDGLATAMTPGNGFIDGALTGDSVDSRIYVGGSSSLALQDALSFSAWAQVTDDQQTHYMRLISKKVSDADLGGYECAYNPINNDLVFTGQGLVAAAVNVDLGTGWNLITVTVDGTAVIFYRNGVAIGGGSITGLMQSDTPVYLGHRAREDADQSGAWFGKLDDMRLYNYALDAAVVQSLYNETLRSPDSLALSSAGLLYDYYNGAWTSLPEFDALTPTYSNSIADFDISPRSNDDNFAFQFHGYVEILEHGAYTFYTRSDDGSQLFIGDTMVVDNDGRHGAQERSGTIRLQTGLHAIRGTYFERGGNQVFEVSYSALDSALNLSKQLIPAERLYRDGNHDFPPTVQLSVVDDIQVSLEGASVLISAQVSDTEDGNIPDNAIEWVSSIDGIIATGTQFDISGLSIGDHIITVTASDSQPRTASDSISISIIALSDLRDADLPATVAAGIDYRYFEQSWTALPDFSQFTPDLAGIVAQPDLGPRLREDNYAFVYTGYLLIPTDGVYTLGINSDDGSQLSIGGVEVIDNDGLHGSVLRTASIGLKAGLHAISMEFFERTGNAVFTVQWSGPGISTVIIPASQYFRDDINHPPMVSIVTPSTVIAVKPNTNIDFTASAIDGEDGNLPENQWQWSSDRDGVLGTGSNFSTTSLSDGTHVITLTVSDSESLQGSAQITVVISGADADTGLVNRDVWTGIGGTTLSSLTNHVNYPDAPDISDTLSSFETPVNGDNNYGTRVRGYLHAPVTGTYTFWIASDDQGALYLSSDDDSANATTIAEVLAWTRSRQWDKYSQQKSINIELIAGQRYYIEALQKEGGGGDNLAVAWAFPGSSRSVIDGSFLSPYVPVGNN